MPGIRLLRRWVRRYLVPGRRGAEKSCGSVPTETVFEKASIDNMQRNFATLSLLCQACRFGELFPSRACVIKQVAEADTKLHCYLSARFETKLGKNAFDGYESDKIRVSIKQVRRLCLRAETLRNDKVEMLKTQFQCMIHNPSHAASADRILDQLPAYP